jgi:dihydropteroate synthase
MFTLNCKGRLLVIDQPKVMGILNATPDSFFEGSRFANDDKLLHHVGQMVRDGADIIDVGGQSTRPGSEKIAADEELKRVIPIISNISKHFPDLFISVDTFYAGVAKEAVAAGASIVNDISAGSLDEAMIDTVASLQVPYVLMHMKGTPQTMHVNPEYANVTREVLDFLTGKMAELNKKGINDVIIDPGFGFGKTIRHNFTLLKGLSLFKILERPILVGISRKSTISKTLGVTAEESLNGTTVLNTIGLMNGALLLRVHDVKPAKEAVRLYCELTVK